MKKNLFPTTQFENYILNDLNSGKFNNLPEEKFHECCSFTPNFDLQYLASSQKMVTDFVERALKEVAPKEYACRASGYRHELVQGLGHLGNEQIAVFVCTTAFPYVACPLFVYEPRYRLMVRRCVESGIRQFGIAACLNREATGVKRLEIIVFFRPENRDFLTW